MRTEEKGNGGREGRRDASKRKRQKGDAPRRRRRRRSQDGAAAKRIKKRNWGEKTRTEITPFVLGVATPRVVNFDWPVRTTPSAFKWARRIKTP